MPDSFELKMTVLDAPAQPRCKQCDRTLSPHGEYLACPCCGELYIYFAKLVGKDGPHQNGWERTNLTQDAKAPYKYTVLGRHSCLMGNRQESAEYVWYVNAEGKRVKRKKTPAERKIDREVKYSQGSFDDYA